MKYTLLILTLAVSAWARSDEPKSKPGPGQEIGSGAAVGTPKGTGKIDEGIGQALKKLF